GADHLPINNDGNRAGLRKIIHKGWSEVFSASHHLIGFGSGTPPAQRRLGLQQRGVDSVHRRTFHRVRLDEIAAPIQNGDRNGLLVLCGPRRTRVDKGARAGARNDFDVPRVLHRGSICGESKHRQHRNEKHVKPDAHVFLREIEIVGNRFVSGCYHDPSFRRNDMNGMTRLAAMIALATLCMGAQQTTRKFVPVTDAMLQKPDPANWLMWRRTLASWGYSPLNQINRTNVAPLRLAWPRGLGPGNTQEATPLVYDGVMYIPNPGDYIQALDARTGDLVWDYKRKLANPRLTTKRNIAIYGT